MNLVVLLYAACVIALIMGFFYYKRQLHPIITAITGMGSGVLSLLLLHFILQQFGIILALNYFTILLSLAFGAPGVLGITIYTLFL